MKWLYKKNLKYNMDFLVKTKFCYMNKFINMTNGILIGVKKFNLFLLVAPCLP
jgi:hypothetical protein